MYCFLFFLICYIIPCRILYEKKNKTLYNVCSLPSPVTCFNGRIHTGFHGLVVTGLTPNTYTAALLPPLCHCRDSSSENQEPQTQYKHTESYNMRVSPLCTLLNRHLHRVSPRPSLKHLAVTPCFSWSPSAKCGA